MMGCKNVLMEEYALLSLNYTSYPFLAGALIISLLI